MFANNLRRFQSSPCFIKFLILPCSWAGKFGALLDAHLAQKRFM